MYFDKDPDAEYWYRYVEHTESSGYFTEDGDYYSTGPGKVVIQLREYKVLRHTPKGVWIECFEVNRFDRPERFVRIEARKRYACPTREEALESFIARKKRQASIYSARLRTAKTAIKMAEKVKVSCPTSLPETMNERSILPLSLEN